MDRIPRIMFVYGGVTGVAGLGWLLYDLASGAMPTILDKSALFISGMVVLCVVVPFSLPLNRRRAGEWQPLFEVTAQRIAAALILLLLSFLNVWFWPLASKTFSAPVLFILVLPAMSLFGSLLNALKWAFGLENVFTPGIVRFWTTGGASLLPAVTKPVIHGFQGPPDVNFEEWIFGMREVSELIADPVRLRQVWIAGDRTISELEDYIALHAAVFVLLESDRCTATYRKRLTPSAHHTLRKFVRELQRFDAKFNRTPEWRDPEILLFSPEWRAVEALARDVSHLLDTPHQR